MILFHGSSLDIEGKLKTHKAFEREDYDASIYFTDEKVGAVLYSINPIRAYIKKYYKKDLLVSATSAHKMKRKGVWEIFELYPDMFNDLFNDSKFFHSCCFAYDFHEILTFRKTWHVDVGGVVRSEDGATS